MPCPPQYILTASLCIALLAAATVLLFRHRVHKRSKRTQRSQKAPPHSSSAAALPRKNIADIIFAALGLDLFMPHLFAPKYVISRCLSIPFHHQ